MRRRDMLAGSGMIWTVSLPNGGSGHNTAAGSKTDSPPDTAPGTEIVATIDFIHEPDQRLRGTEHVRYRFTEDGGVWIEIHSVSFDPPVVRDVSYMLDSNFYPVECYVKIEADRRFAGSGLYSVGKNAVGVTGRNGDGEPVSKTFAIDGPVKSIVSHPVSSDILVSMAADRSKPGVVSRTRGAYLTSADAYGRAVPEWKESDIAVQFIGVESFETPLGMVEADHFLLNLPSADGGYEPFEDLWCLTGTPVFLGAYARQPTSTRYRLRSIEVVNGGSR
ncbi:MAG: hypothetical protein V7675_00065 [Hyphomonas sp.]